MQLSNYLRSIILIFAFLIVSVILAQGDAAFDFSVPDGWEMEEIGPEQVVLTGGDDVISVFGAGFVADTLGDIDFEDDAGALVAFLESMDLTVEDAVLDTMGGISARAFIGGEDGQGIAVSIPSDDGLIVMTVLSPAEDLSNETLAAVAMVGGELANVGVAAPDPCIISTGNARTVRVHVGPGTNRTPISFLPDGVDFVVEGQAEDNDGAMWFRVDKEQAAPGKSANEAWVAAGDVDESGDCSAVGDVSAPPIIPIITAPPTPVPDAEGDSGDDAGGETASSPVTGTGSGVFMTTNGTSPHAWHNQLPGDMRAASASSARVIVFVTESLNTVENCTYYDRNGNTYTYRRDRIVYQLRAVSSAGVEVGFMQADGGEPPGCPNYISITTTFNGPPPTVESAIDWLRGFLG